VADHIRPRSPVVLLASLPGPSGTRGMSTVKQKSVTIDRPTKIIKHNQIELRKICVRLSFLRTGPKDLIPWIQLGTLAPNCEVMRAPGSITHEVGKPPQ
jgi:hypothetical protein